MIQWKEGLSAALSNIAGQQHLSGFADQISRSTFLLQRWLDLHGIPVRVEIGEGSHCSKGTPRHFLFKTKHFWRNKGKNYLKDRRSLIRHPDIRHISSQCHGMCNIEFTQTCYEDVASRFSLRMNSKNAKYSLLLWWQVGGLLESMSAETLHHTGILKHHIKLCRTDSSS